MGILYFVKGLGSYVCGVFEKSHVCRRIGRNVAKDLLVVKLCKESSLKRAIWSII